MVAPILRQTRVLLAAGGTPKVGRVLEPGLRLGCCIWLREELQKGFVAAVHAQAMGFGAGALLPALPAPQRSLPLSAALLPGQSRTVCTCLWGLMMLGGF